jgi:hypothetical protein
MKGVRFQENQNPSAVSKIIILEVSRMRSHTCHTHPLEQVQSTKTARQNPDSLDSVNLSHPAPCTLDWQGVTD